MHAASVRSAGAKRENGSRTGRGGVAGCLDVPRGREGQTRKDRLRGGALRRASDDRRHLWLRLRDESRRPCGLRGACAEASRSRRAVSAALHGEHGPLCGTLGMRPAWRRRVQHPGERLRCSDPDVRERRDRRLRERRRLWRALSNRALGRAVPGNGRGGPGWPELLRGVWIAERRIRGRAALARPPGGSDAWRLPVALLP